MPKEDFAAESRKLETERSFHDIRARQTKENKTRVFFYQLGGLSNEYKVFLEMLGPLDGQKVLDFGCGRGEGTLNYARKGAEVVALDVSGDSLALTKLRALDQGLGDKVACIQASGETLPFQNAFDKIAGVAVLHHMDFCKAIDGIGGALKADGSAVFMEPLFHNPIIRFYRFCTPRKRTRTERPLTMDQISFLGSRFSQVRVQYYGLLSILALPLLMIRLYGAFDRINNGLTRIDNSIASTIPFFRKYFWGCIFEVRNYESRKQIS